MRAKLYTWTPAQFRAHEVLVAHQRRDIGSCICGWGVDTGNVGQSHAGHVIDEINRAGLTLSGFADADLDPCKACHPELHRSQCWPNSRCIASDGDEGAN